MRSKSRDQLRRRLRRALGLSYPSDVAEGNRSHYQPGVDALAGSGNRHETELQSVIADGRSAARLEALALLAFAPDELAAISPEHRKVLDMLIRRRLERSTTEPDIADCLRIRQQFESYCDNQTGSSAGLRLAAQLR